MLLAHLRAEPSQRVPLVESREGEYLAGKREISRCGGYRWRLKSATGEIVASVEVVAH